VAVAFSQAAAAPSMHQLANVPRPADAAYSVPMQLHTSAAALLRDLNLMQQACPNRRPT
jgi:hypothetical protein